MLSPNFSLMSFSISHSESRALPRTERPLATMSKKAQKEAMEIGINGAIVGDLLTTLGSTIAEDRALCEEAGYEW